MFKTCSPESAGIPSKKVLRFIKALELQCLNLKNIILKALMQWRKQEQNSAECNYIILYKKNKAYLNYRDKPCYIVRTDYYFRYLSAKSMNSCQSFSSRLWSPGAL